LWDSSVSETVFSSSSSAQLSSSIDSEALAEVDDSVATGFLTLAGERRPR
jgi:hypothetical protein